MEEPGLALPDSSECNGWLGSPNSYRFSTHNPRLSNEVGRAAMAETVCIQ